MEQLWSYSVRAVMLCLLVLLAGCQTEPFNPVPPRIPETSSKPPPTTKLTSQSTQNTSSVHLTLGNPSNATTSTANANNYLMLKPQYALSYNRSKGIPNWVSWQLNSSWLGNAPRQNNFRPDTTLPEGWYRVRPSDYTNTGYDKGHLAPSADRTKSVEDNASTFLMTNMIPQAPDNNQGYWADLEDYARSLVEQGNALYIIAGSYGTQGTIAQGKVTVPTRLYKIIVVINSSGDNRISAATRIIAIDTPNINGDRNANWRTFLTSVDAIEAKTKYDFLSNVSPSIQKIIEAEVDRVSQVSPNTTVGANSTSRQNCDASYPGVCIPPAPPDLDCKDISYRKFKVLPSDPHRFDPDRDGIGCES